MVTNAMLLFFLCYYQHVERVGRALGLTHSSTAVICTRQGTRNRVSITLENDQGSYGESQSFKVLKKYKM